MPKRIQLSRKKGWRMPENTVKVDRSTRWGNPYKWTEFYFPGQNTVTDACRQAVDKFRGSVESEEILELLYDGGWIDVHERPYYTVPAWVRRLRGKNLACWCPLDRPCHADVLLEIANQ